MAKFTVYEKGSGKKHRCEGADVKELTEGENAFYTKVEAKTEPSKVGSDEVNEKIYTIVEAIKKLDRDNIEHFTRRGLPRDTALEAVLGYAVSAEERAEAWNIVQTHEEQKK